MYIKKWINQSIDNKNKNMTTTIIIVMISTAIAMTTISTIMTE